MYHLGITRRNALRVYTLGRLHVPGAEAVLAGTVTQPRHLAVPALLASACESGLARDKVAGYHWPDDEEGRARLASIRLYRLCGRTSARTTSSAAPELLSIPSP